MTNDKHQNTKLVRTTEGSPYGWINFSDQNLNVQRGFKHLVIDIWNPHKTIRVNS